MHKQTVVAITVASLAMWLVVLAIAYALVKAPGWTALGLGALALTLSLIGLERRLKLRADRSGECVAASSYD